jgi:hypothetical protein
MTENTQWTGLPVAYLFFARMLPYGFAIAVPLFARNGSRVACLVALYGCLFYLDSIVIGGRRQDTGEFGMIILLAWWFQRDRCIARPLMPWVHMAIFPFPGIYFARRRGAASQLRGGNQLARARIVEPYFPVG